MRAALGEQLVVGIAHHVGLAAAEHDLEIDRLEAAVVVAMDDAGRAGDAFPRAEARGQALARFVLDEDIEEALQHEEDLLDLMGVRRVALAGLDIHDREREIPGGNDRGIAMLARAAGTDEAVLRSAIALDLGVLEGGPIGL